MSRVEIRDLGEPEAVVTIRWARPTRFAWPERWSATMSFSRAGAGRTRAAPGRHRLVRALPPGRCPQWTDGRRTDEGEEVVIGPNQVFDLPPGHLTWVEGDEELVMVDWAGGAGFDVQPGESARVMATILFTDIVGSTEQAHQAGDAAWKQTVAMHDDVVRTVLRRFGGREVETAGDSFLIASMAPSAPSAVDWRWSEPLAAIRSRSASASTAARWS